MPFCNVLKRARVSHIRFLEIARYSQLIQEGDVVLLLSRDSSREPIFSKPLKRGSTINSRWGAIKHDELIGKSPRQLVQVPKGGVLRVQLPTLEEYVVLTPRLVTPIYPADANLIISLLDIHVSPPSSTTSNAPPLEILEAGTGHGALTLYLARAIHAANPVQPDHSAHHGNHSPRAESQENRTHVWNRIFSWIWSGEQNLSRQGHRKSPLLLSEPTPKRAAVVRSLDISATHSKHAEKVLRGFRRGMYAANVEFEVGDVSEWIEAQIVSRNLGSRPRNDQTFLSHVLLDLPGSENHVEKAASVLHVDGILMVFNPSITQIVGCVELVRKEKLPLILDRVVELGAGMTGGKIWDVRAVKLRSAVRNKANGDETRHEPERVMNDSVVPVESSLEDGSSLPLEGELSKKGTDESDVVMVCRPKVGHRLTGGGFLAVWRKMRHQER